MNNRSDGMIWNLCLGYLNYMPLLKILLKMKLSLYNAGWKNICVYVFINIEDYNYTCECPTLSCNDLALLTLPHSPGWFWVGTFLFRTRLYSLRLPMGIMLIASLLNLPDKKGLTSSCFRIENPFISKRISPVSKKNTLNLND